MDDKAKRSPYIENSNDFTKHNLQNEWDNFLKKEGTKHFYHGLPDDYLSDYNAFSNVYYLYNKTYKSKVNDKEYPSTNGLITGVENYQVGYLKTYDVNGSKRFTYDIEINNGVILKILYNWNLDNFRQHNFDGQDRNDLSISFIVESKSGKFLSTGDGSGRLENSLLKYYDGTNVLKNITLFKAAHHGSIASGENSEEFFMETTPKVVVVTGIIQPTRENLPLGSKDNLYNKLSGVTTLKEEFFNNINKANPNSNILINKVVYRTNNNDFKNAPLHGDIKIVFKNNNHYIHYNYIGTVKAYINQDKGNIEFTTYKNNQQTYLYELWKETLKYERLKVN